jgi:NAD(P)-dependent dehydrogenase (short-subunit alcohol dehydrogenase family)
MSLALGARAAAEGATFSLVQRQLVKPKPLPSNIQLTDQVAVVTGSNAGLGLAASRHLLRLGLGRLIMGVRSEARGEEAAQRLRVEFPKAEVSVWILDLASYDSVRTFAARCADELPRLDIAIMNVGGMPHTYEIAPGSGHELTITVNYLSTALLSILLLPVLRAWNEKKRKSAGSVDDSRPPVLCVVNSDLVWSTAIETAGPVLQRFDDAKAFSQPRWYALSKLILTLFIWKLAEVVSPDEVLINMPNPGMTGGTDFFSREPLVVRAAIRVIQSLLARKPDVAASIYVDAAVARGAESHGSFLSDWTIKP